MSLHMFRSLNTSIQAFAAANIRLHVVEYVFTSHLFYRTVKLRNLHREYDNSV